MGDGCWFRPAIRTERCFRSNCPSTVPALRDIVLQGRAGRPILSQAKEEMNVKEAEAQRVVYVIDDDASMRNALESLLGSVGLRVETFGSAQEVFEKKLPEAAICLVVDIRLPGLSGLDFQAELSRANIDVPIIFITGHGDIAMTVKAMKAGAVEFLTKPFRDQDLLDAVKFALEKDEAKRNSRKTIAVVRSLYDSLTPREQEVIGLVTAGLMNKQVAAEMGVSEITVKVHRGNVMRKMGAKSLADLVRIADTLGIRRRMT
jgi:FixJ family two-component response regulator